MGKFVIAPHFRLQEWVAEEKGYFKAEGLAYEFRDSWGKGDTGRTHAVPDKFGAYQTFEKGREEGEATGRDEAFYVGTIRVLANEVADRFVTHEAKQ